MSVRVMGLWRQTKTIVSRTRLSPREVLVVSGKLCHAAPKSRDHFSIFINFITLLDTIFYRKSLEVTSEW